MGRYSDYAPIEGTIGGFSYSGQSGVLGDVYNLTLNIPFASIEMKYGPQGRNFKSSLSFDSDIVAKLEKIGIPIGNVEFGSDRVSLTILDKTYSYGRNQLDTVLVEDIVQRIGEGNRDIAEKIATTLGSGMDAIGVVADEVLTVNSLAMSPRETFKAKFDSAPGTYFKEDVPGGYIEGKIQMIGDIVTVTTFSESPSQEELLDIVEDSVSYYDTLEGYTFFATETYENVTSSENSVAEIFKAIDDLGISLTLYLNIAEFGFNSIGRTSERGTDYYLFNFDNGIESAFESSFNYGFGDTTGEVGIVDGTIAADVIDDSYVDPDGDMITDGKDTVQAGFGDDTIYGGDGKDKLLGDAGDDHLYGEGGNDSLYGGEGADVLEGGAGMDRAGYNDAASGVIVDLVRPSKNSGEAAGDSYLSIENVHGSRHADNLRGDEGANALWGWHGNDKLYGRDGNDKLYGGSGNDILYGGNGADILKGDSGNDRLFGHAGNDILQGGSGLDVLSGDAGSDVFLFEEDDLASSWQGDVLVNGDRITDFVIGEDKIRIDIEGVDSFDDLHIGRQANENSMVIEIQGPNQTGHIILEGFDSLSELYENRDEIFEFV